MAQCVICNRFHFYAVSLFPLFIVREIDGVFIRSNQCDMIPEPLKSVSLFDQIYLVYGTEVPSFRFSLRENFYFQPLDFDPTKQFLMLRFFI